MLNEKKMTGNLAIIIPAHNEEKRIARTIETYAKFFENKKDEREVDGFFFLIVLNACRDKTQKIVKDFSEKYKSVKYIEFKEGGKGFAILEGFKEALKSKADLIGFVDADMATPPECFFDLIKKIKDVDVTIASRGLKESVVKTSFTRKLTNRGFNFFVRSILLLPYKDTQCGAKLFRRKVIEKVLPEIGITRWAFDIDLIFKIRKKGFKIKEVATVWNDIEGSKIDLIKTPLQMFSAIMRIRLINSPFNFVVRAYDTMPEKIKIHNMLT